ncbi:MAG: hypothetical protein JNK74_08575 [Candidatus Hydrogenedentes bacterium]|nr:hypothetical protein [Candidatus Hydrogenedentota bacterium]
MLRNVPAFFTSLFFALMLLPSAYAAHLSPRNTEVPFPYLAGATRSWPILQENFPVGARMTFVARRDGATLAQGNVLTLPGLRVELDREQQLTIAAEATATEAPFDLEVSLSLPGGEAEAQTLRIQPGPPKRPLSYYSDFGDDLIRIFNAPDGTWRPVTKDAFDQYFRRCQLQGIDRLITWLGPMPYITAPSNYAPEDWARYEAQARALNESEEFKALVTERLKGAQKGEWGLHISWDWIRQLNAFRLMRDFGPMLSRSAEQHGVKLSVSFRPFEPALTKYYELPTFDEKGAYLWGFLPMATPPINYRTSETSFGHYRTVLQKMGHEDRGRIGAIAIPGCEGAAAFLQRFNATGDNLRIVASDYPPLLAESLVLQREADGQFALVQFAGIAEQAEAQLQPVTGFSIREDQGTVRIEGLDVPFQSRYLILSNPANAEEALDFPTLSPVTLFARAGNRIGRENVYWVLDDDPALAAATRVPGIPSTGDQATEFNATETGYRHLFQQGQPRTALRGKLLVIDLGAAWSVEMLDLNQPLMRANAIKELKTVLDLPAFDEIFVNTRSHVQLSAYQGDGEEGIQPLMHYRENRKHYAHLGIDRAYAPIAAADDPVLRTWAADPAQVEKITTWQPGEWEGDCQTEASPYRWRFARNKAVAGGLRTFLGELEAAFPDTRIRAVIPMAEASATEVRNEIAQLKRPDGTPYGPGDNGGVWSTINYIDTIGEGMAMLDLSGLRTEPVLFGIRDVPPAGPFDAHLRGSFRDLVENRGSSFRGPRSFFFEAQYTLRRQDYDTARAEREGLILKVLAHKEEVNEVILYESADWLYFLPFGDPVLSGHGFLDAVTK